MLELHVFLMWHAFVGIQKIDVTSNMGVQNTLSEINQQLKPDVAKSLNGMAIRGMSEAQCVRVPFSMCTHFCRRN